MAYNAHYANMVAAIFLATGQDAAHVVEGSLGITTAENRNGDLYFSVNLPDLPVATVGGGTSLEVANEGLNILGVAGSGHAKEFAEKLTNWGMRVTVDAEDKNIGTKIKNARLDRIPYMFIIGDNEVAANGVTVRSRKEGELGCMPLDDIFNKLMREVTSKAK